MPKVIAKLSLKEMRERLQISQEDAGIRLANALGRKDPYTHARISQIESEGHDNIRLLKAWGEIFGQPLDDVIAASQALRK